MNRIFQRLDGELQATQDTKVQRHLNDETCSFVSLWGAARDFNQIARLPKQVLGHLDEECGLYSRQGEGQEVQAWSNHLRVISIPSYL